MTDPTTSGPSRALTPLQREALGALANTYPGAESDNAVHSGIDCYWDGQAWIGFRTAEALRRRGLVVVSRAEPYDEYPAIWLTEAGRAAASGSARSQPAVPTDRMSS